MSEWWHSKTPNAITPHLWLSPEAVAFLDSIDRPEWNVLEHGAGGSTLWFAKRCNWVLSIETNKKWYLKLLEMTGEYKKMSVILADESIASFIPYTVRPAVKWRFDFLMIDGEPIADRIIWAKHAQNLVHPGGWVCFDNCNRPEFTEAREYLRSISDEVVTFDGNQLTPVHTQFLVTEFCRLKL